MELYDPYYNKILINYYMFWIYPGLIPIVTIHQTQNKHQKRKKCNGNNNRIVFVAEIENLETLKTYYNLNDINNDDINGYLKQNKQSYSNSDSDEEYEYFIINNYKNIKCNWYSNDIDLNNCKSITTDNNKLMIKQKNKNKKNECITGGNIYTFNVECILNNGLICISSITIGTNNPPFGGYCYIKEYENINSDLIIIELKPNEYEIELNIICMNWNDEHLPLTQNIRSIYP